MFTFQRKFVGKNMDNQKKRRGTCILTARPFAYVLKSKYRQERCDYCLKAGKVLKCSACQYVYYCDRGCQSSAWLTHRNECKHLRNALPRTIPDMARMLVRILLKLKTGGDLEKGYYTESSYRKFWDLMSHYSDIKLDAKRAEHFEALSAVLHDIMGDEILPNSCELMGIYGRLLINTFNILDDDMNSIGSGLYLGASIIDHNCKPNAVATFIETTLRIHLIEDIPCLDWAKIFISYVDTMCDPEERRRDLKECYYFLCTCSRCVDVTERNEMHGASCVNKQCDGCVYVNRDKCQKCGTFFIEKQRKLYNEVMELTKDNLETMKEYTYLDVCKMCLAKQKGVLHPLNLWHVKTLDAAFESAIAVNKWSDALEFGLELIHGFRKYYGSWNPLLGLLYMKIGKIQLEKNMDNEAHKNLNEAIKIIGVSYGTDHNCYKEAVKLIYQTRFGNDM